MSAPEEQHAAAAAAAATAEKKKNPKQDAKEARLAARLAEEAARQKAKEDALSKYKDIVGRLDLVCSRTHKTKDFVPIRSINTSMKDQTVHVRARVQTTRKQAKFCFMVLRETFHSIQCIVAPSETIPAEMVQFAGSINPESIVDIEAIVVIPQKPTSTTQSDVELQVLKLHIVSDSLPVLPFQFEDASRPDAELASDEGAAAADEKRDKLATVNLDTRLNCRWMDMRTRASNALFRLESRIGQYFRNFLIDKDFVEIHTPKMIGAASEGGCNVFKMNYFGREAYLAQSPQLYKQMVLQGDLERVFELAPAFRAENSLTHRHMTEFISMDLEMRIKEHYYEVLDMAEELFAYMFDRLAENTELLDAVREQHPFTPVEYRIPSDKIEAHGVGVIDENVQSTDKYGARIRNRKLSVLRIPFPGGVALYNDHPGVEKIPSDEDIGTEAERLIGKLVKERYGVDYFIMDRYPASARPFYTMPDGDDPKFSNSYDMFIRGQEIVSGAQRIHDPELLIRRCRECGADPDAFKDYIDSFRLGAWPHGGFAIGLERMVFLYLGLTNVRYATIFPRDPKRITP